MKFQNITVESAAIPTEHSKKIVWHMKININVKSI